MPNDRPATTLGSVTDARVAAADVCTDLRGGELLDASFERRTAALDARDRRWTRELLYEMLRRRSWLDALLSERVRGGLARLDPDLTDLLRLGGYQLLAMGSVPAYAAIAQTVELAKRRHGIGASKLANAVLRRLDRERDALHVATPTDPVEALALEGAGVHVEDAPLVRDSLLIQPGVSLTELGAFRQGLFFVQDPAATLVTEYAAIPPGSTVADLCAAPGGKTVELARHAAAVFSADRSPGRLRRVLATLQRLEVRNVFPLVGDAREPALRPVDAVLVDVPCTGTGTFRRHPDARWRLRISDIAVMAALQRAIVRSAARAVRPGGLLVYSTCSLEPEENDAQIESFLAEHPDWRLEPPPEGSVPAAVLDAGRLRVLPQRHGADGSFAARLRRTA